MNLIQLLDLFKKDLRFSKEDMIGAQKFFNFIMEHEGEGLDQWITPEDAVDFEKRRIFLKNIRTLRK